MLAPFRLSSVITAQETADENCAVHLYHPGMCGARDRAGPVESAGNARHRDAQRSEAAEYSAAATADADRAAVRADRSDARDEWTFHGADADDTIATGAAAAHVVDAESEHVIDARDTRDTFDAIYDVDAVNVDADARSTGNAWSRNDGERSAGGRLGNAWPAALSALR